MINPALIQIALENCGTSEFERYSQTVMGGVIGPHFKPLGGMHDGGADGFIEAEIKEQTEKPTSFFQASKQLTVEAKIKNTVSRLRDFGREVTSPPKALAKARLISSHRSNSSDGSASFQYAWYPLPEQTITVGASGKS